MNIKKFRERRGITATNMAKMLNVGRKTYYNYENGRTDPSLRTFAKICKILEISADEALEIKGDALSFAEPNEDELETIRKAKDILEHYSHKKTK